jgi:hypothetical protein
VHEWTLIIVRKVTNLKWGSMGERALVGKGIAVAEEARGIIIR